MNKDCRVQYSGRNGIKGEGHFFRSLVQRYPKLRPRLCSCKPFHEKYRLGYAFTLFRYARRRPGDSALRSLRVSGTFLGVSYTSVYLDGPPKKNLRISAALR